MKKILLLISFCCSFLFSSNLKYDIVLDYANELDKKYNVDKKIILSYILTESNGIPFAMLIKLKEPKILSEVLTEYGLKHKKSEKYISVFPDSQTQAEFLYEFIKKYEKKLGILDYDLGIMQINKKTINRLNLSEKKVYLNIYQNMDTGTKVMRQCYDILKNKTSIKNILECYNRGTSLKWLNQSKRVYLNNFLNNYKKIEKGEF